MRRKRELEVCAELRRPCFHEKRFRSEFHTSLITYHSPPLSFVSFAIMIFVGKTSVGLLILSLGPAAVQSFCLGVNGCSTNRGRALFASAEANAVSFREQMMKQRFVYEGKLSLDEPAVEEVEVLATPTPEEIAALAAEQLAAEQKAVSVRTAMLATRLTIQAEAAAAEKETREKNEELAVQMANSKQQPKTPEVEAELASKYGDMSEEDRAFAILLDLGIIQDSKSFVENDEFCDEYLFV